MNILCVGDDTESLELTTVFLERKLPSVTIHTTESVTDAKAFLETEPIVCVVSDYDMPDQNGLEFLQTVRETHSDLPFILFTGKGSEEIASEAISAGVTDYLQKRGQNSTTGSPNASVMQFLSTKRSTNCESV